eukprot:TRINITY_DN776023_c0_g1_i1.p1 TRINITY_DN776023_c0_g1~~TRINITY_DN776023_c0_g1_i1.p1  ORF type:complete len:237 (-),score=60.89 TRINITY_DN776023_c0_g1_i1:253-963(-)
MSITGYTGCSGVRQVITVKPGEKESNLDSKFSALGQSIISKDMPTLSASYQTMNETTTRVRPEHFHTRSINFAKEKAKSIPPPKRTKFVAMTTSQANFRNYSQQTNNEKTPLANNGRAPTAQIHSRTAASAVTAPRLQSSYETDMGRADEIPASRPTMRGTGMLSTTNDLYQGTSKVSAHLPGYCGFIPQTNVAPITHEAAPRDTFHSKTLLTTTHNIRMPGYTGFLPKAPSNVRS